MTRLTDKKQIFVGLDPVLWIRIQGFADQKLKKKYNLIFLYLFDQKLQFTYL